jgi:hypothetical protein
LSINACAAAIRWLARACIADRGGFRPALSGGGSGGCFAKAMALRGAGLAVVASGGEADGSTLASRGVGSGFGFAAGLGSCPRITGLSRTVDSCWRNTG